MKFKPLFLFFISNRGIFWQRNGGYDDLRRNWGGIATRYTPRATNRAISDYYASRRLEADMDSKPNPTEPVSVPRRNRTANHGPRAVPVGLHQALRALAKGPATLQPAGR